MQSGLGPLLPTLDRWEAGGRAVASLVSPGWKLPQVSAAKVLGLHLWDPCLGQTEHLQHLTSHLVSLTLHSVGEETGRERDSLARATWPVCGRAGIRIQDCGLLGLCP